VHGVPYHYLPIIDGRKAEQEKRMMELSERSDSSSWCSPATCRFSPPEACRYFDGRAINIHHSFLPGFKGAKAYHQAFTRGVKLIAPPLTT